MGNDAANVTMLLNALQEGDRTAVDKLFPLVYEELRRSARSQRFRRNKNATMNTTAIVHEAYLKLADQPRQNWENRAHFFAVAAIAMRHIFLDYAKRKKRLKRGGGAAHVSVEDVLLPDPESILDDEQAERMLSLDGALQKLESKDPRLARVVECRFFGGMTVADTAVALGISPATVKRDWTLARARLYKVIHEM